RGGAVRRHQPRDRLLGALHEPGETRAAEARDRAGADVSGPGPGLRARRAAGRGRRAGEPRPARPEGEQARRGERLPLSIGELVAARAHAGGRNSGHDRGRESRVCIVIAVAETYLDETAERYRSSVVEAVADEVEVLDSFVLGSGLVGGYRPGESDLDLVLVVDRPLEGASRRRAIERVAALELPGRRLQLVAYGDGRPPPDFDLNLEVDDEGVREVPGEADH